MRSFPSSVVYSRAHQDEDPLHTILSLGDRPGNTRDNSSRHFSRLNQQRPTPTRKCDSVGYPPESELAT